MSTMDSWTAYYLACEKRREKQKERLERAKRSTWWYVGNAAHAVMYAGVLAWTAALGQGVISSTEQAWTGFVGCLGAALSLIGIGAMVLAEAMQECEERHSAHSEGFKEEAGS